MEYVNLGLISIVAVIGLVIMIKQDNKTVHISSLINNLSIRVTGSNADGTSVPYAYREQGLESREKDLSNRLTSLEYSIKELLEVSGSTLTKDLKDDINLVISTDYSQLSFNGEIYVNNGKVCIYLVCPEDMYSNKSVPLTTIIDRAKELKSLQAKLCCPKKPTKRAK
jgi:hypothetical protein